MSDESQFFARMRAIASSADYSHVPPLPVESKLSPVTMPPPRVSPSAQAAAMQHPVTCGAMRQGDEMTCTTPGCGLRWSLDENRPECPRR